MSNPTDEQLAIHMMNNSAEIPGPLATNCRVWLGARDRHGYGQIRYKGKLWLVHRLLWSNEIGPISANLGIFHHCDMPACNHLGHLFSGTQADNIADMQNKGRNFIGVGVTNGNAKLNEEQVREIRALICTGLTYKKIGAKFGVSYEIVGKIKRGQLWTHIS